MNIHHYRPYFKRLWNKYKYFFILILLVLFITILYNNMDFYNYSPIQSFKTNIGIVPTVQESYDIYDEYKTIMRIPSYTDINSLKGPMLHFT